MVACVCSGFEFQLIKIQFPTSNFENGDFCTVSGIFAPTKSTSTRTQNTFLQLRLAQFNQHTSRNRIATATLKRVHICMGLTLDSESEAEAELFAESEELANSVRSLAAEGALLAISMSLLRKKRR